MSAAIRKAITKRSRTYVVQRRGAVTTSATTGLGVGGAVLAATLFCHIQPYKGPALADAISGAATVGRIKIWVADTEHVILDAEAVDVGDLQTDPGSGGSGPPGDVVIFDGHRWRVTERSSWELDGEYRQYLARDEGAA